MSHHLNWQGKKKFTDFLNRGFKKLVLKIGGLKVQKYVNRGIKVHFSQLTIEPNISTKLSMHISR